MHKIPLAAALFFLFSTFAQAQDFRWQQKAEYVMDVTLDVASHKLAGTQKLTYHNNSHDTLTKVFYHLYFNAFQPGSMMDVRSRHIQDPDPRVGDRIASLKEGLKVNGTPFLFLRDGAAKWAAICFAPEIAKDPGRQRIFYQKVTKNIGQSSQKQYTNNQQPTT